MTTTKRIVLSIFVICMTTLTITVESRWMGIVALVIFLVLLFSPWGEKQVPSSPTSARDRR